MSFFHHPVSRPGDTNGTHDSQSRSQLDTSPLTRSKTEYPGIITASDGNQGMMRTLSSNIGVHVPEGSSKYGGDENCALSAGKFSSITFQTNSCVGLRSPSPGAYGATCSSAFSKQHNSPEVALLSRAKSAPPQGLSGDFCSRAPGAGSRKTAPNRVCCNALLAAYARADPPQWQKALKLLQLMWLCGGEVCPDIVSYNTVMKACGNAQQLDMAFQVSLWGKLNSQ